MACLSLESVEFERTLAVGTAGVVDCKAQEKSLFGTRRTGLRHRPKIPILTHT